MTQSFIRWAGFVGSLLLGTVAVLKGDITTGVGIVAAALSSASVIPSQK